MKKFEYLVVDYDVSLYNNNKLKEEILDKYGEEGWELCFEKTNIIFSAYSYFIFKREKA